MRRNICEAQKSSDLQSPHNNLKKMCNKKKQAKNNPTNN